jgi:hypothetical protein
MSAPPAAIFPGDLTKYSKKELQELCLELQLNVNDSKGKTSQRRSLCFGQRPPVPLNGQLPHRQPQVGPDLNGGKKTKKTSKAKNSTN